MLIHTHKEVSLAKKAQYKALTPIPLYGLCTKKHMTNCGLMSNKIFFEEDLGDEVYKVSKEKSA